MQMTSSERVMSQAKREANVALWLPGQVPLLLRRISPGTFRMGSRGANSEDKPFTGFGSRSLIMSERFP